MREAWGENGFEAVMMGDIVLPVNSFHKVNISMLLFRLNV